MAVLGARRPHVVAWNFVVLGLLAVTLLPMVESLFIGTHHVDPLRLCFLSATLAVGVLNYLPTRSAPAVLLLAVALTGELVSLFAPAVLPGRGELPLFHLLVMLAPWATWGCWRGTRTARSEFDRLWLDFRDRWGLFWAQRVREQFNRAAGHACWPLYLGWSGLHRTAPTAIVAADQAAMLETLRKALQRFMESAPAWTTRSRSAVNADRRRWARRNWPRASRASPAPCHSDR